MKLRTLTLVAIAATSFAVASTSALANHKNGTKYNVKCYGVDSCKNQSSCKVSNGVVMVSKKATCDKLGGSTTNPKAATKDTSTAPKANTPTSQNPVAPQSQANPAQPQAQNQAQPQAQVQAQAQNQAQAQQPAAPAAQTAAVTTNTDQNQ
jgi:hypothetical protein